VLVVGLGMAHAVMWGNYIGTPWKAAFWIALTAFWIGALAYVRLWKPVLMLRCPYRVTAVRPERGNAWTLALEPEGHPGFRFQPGQFTWLSLWNGPLGMREHPFSFSSSAERQGQVAITIRELGDFTSSWPRRCASHAGEGTARDAGSPADDHGVLEQDAPHLLDGDRVALHRVSCERDHER